MTKQAYDTYQKSVAKFLDSNNVKPGCHSANGECESFFSWRSCECCGNTKGGTREEYSFATNNGGIFVAEICLDCIQYLTYGKLDDTTMLEINEGKE